jgi:hypothetical protein
MYDGEEFLEEFETNDRIIINSANVIPGRSSCGCIESKNFGELAILLLVVGNLPKE